MSDVFTKQKRSDVMSKIRGKGNKDTELVMIQIFKEFHIKGWRRNRPLVGKPDFTFGKQRVVVFVDGCFWHSCPQHSTMPKNNREFWKKKLGANKIRDKFVTKELKNKGWIVIRVWEHELGNRGMVVDKIKRAMPKLIDVRSSST